MRGKGEVQWKEKRGFVLSPGPSRVERRAQSQRHSLRDDKPVYAPPPMRPDRPKGLTLSMFGNPEDRLRWTARGGDRTIKRKPVPSAIHGDKDRERKTLSTATTIVGSPRSPRLSIRHSHQPRAAVGPSSLNNPPTIHGARAASEVHPVPPPSSMYSRTQGIRPTQPKNIFRTQSIVRPGNPTEPDIREEDLSHSRIPSTQLTHWSDFRGSDVPAQSMPRHHSAINPPSAPRRTRKLHAIGRKVAAGEYEWWNSDYSDSEDEKVVVPSIARYRANDGGNDEEESGSDYEGDEDDEDIRQRYLDEHEALLRMVQGAQQKVPRTSDYLNTLPERPVENTVTQMRTGIRAQPAGLLNPAGPAGYGSTIRRERSVRR
ncbi:MAG: hypothetical protein Q9178_002884 [Gyalolechia marmorata]